MGIRFLADFLEGDVYYKVHRAGHNLDRCRTQFRLIESIEQQEPAMQRLLLKDMRTRKTAMSGQLTSRERVLAALAHRPTDRVPRLLYEEAIGYTPPIQRLLTNIARPSRPVTTSAWTSQG